MMVSIKAGSVHDKILEGWVGWGGVGWGGVGWGGVGWGGVGWGGVGWGGVGWGGVGWGDKVLQWSLDQMKCDLPLK
jgi:hypothetical protein